MVAECVPMDKRSDLGVDSPIVALEVQPEGEYLLVAYAGGCVAVAMPQSLPEENGTATGPIVADSEQQTAPVEATTTTDATTTDAPAVNGTGDEVPVVQEGQEPAEAHTNGEASEAAAVASETPVATPVKEPSETKKATMKLKELTRSLRRIDQHKHEVEVEPSIPVPPAPRITHLLLRDQPVKWATWRVTAAGMQSNEVTVAYGDGAFQVWPITAVAAAAASSEEDLAVPEPIVVSKRDPPSTPYGPLPCGAIEKILQNPGSIGGGVLTAFSGGLPRAQFNDRHAVSVLQDQEHHVCFQFGSEVKDFIFVPRKLIVPEPTDDCSIAQTEPATHVTSPSPPLNASALIVLTERELVGVDLEQTNWPTFATPYLNCLDLSPVTAVTHLTKVPTGLLKQLCAAASRADPADISNSPWPIWGGSETATADETTDLLSHNECNDLVLLGHANGCISLVGIGRGDSVCCRGTLHTESLFNLSALPNGSKCHETIEVETWPPFRRVGDCAPISHPQYVEQQPDHRLAVTQLLATISEDEQRLSVVVGGAGGQVSIWSASLEQAAATTKHTFEPDVARIQANVMAAYEAGEETDKPKFVWKDLPALPPYEGVAQVCDSASLALSPTALIQLDPPAPITAIAIEPAWHLLAVGSPHGFVVIDLLAQTTIFSDFIHGKLVAAAAQSLSTPAGGATPTTHKHSRQPVSAMQNAIVNRGKQISATMRQSFRRLKHLRTSTTSSKTTTDAAQTEDVTAEQIDTPEAATTETEQTSPVAESSIPVAATETAETQAEQPTTSQEPVTGESTEVIAEVETQPAPPPEPITLNSLEFGGATIRSFLFTDTFLVSSIAATAQQPAIPSPKTPALLVGTANGRALAHSLVWDGESGPVSVQLRKELQLQHHAPVIGMSVLDTPTRSPIGASQRVRTGCEPAPEPTPTVEEASPVAITTTETAPETEGETTTATTEPTKEEEKTVNATPVAPVVPPAPIESHQLLLCSEEQVKLFQLPSLRALHKQKFVDRLHLPGHLGGRSSSAAATAPATPVAPKSTPAKTEPTTTTSTTEQQTPEETVTEAEIATPAEPQQPETKSVPQAHRKSLTAFGVQSFVRGTAEQPKTEWNVVVTRYDGQTAILSLPSLRKVSKVCSHTRPTSPPSIPCVSSMCGANLVLWHTNNGQLLTTELSPVPRLASPAVLAVPGMGTVTAPIVLPEWARPHQPVATNVTTAAVEEPVTAEGEVAVPETAVAVDPAAVASGDVPEGVVNGNSTAPESDTPAGKSYTPMSSNAACHAGDVTMDSIREYLNGEGTVSIKTIETSCEKHTLVEGGHVVTTLHETERVDGKLTKDDMVKFASDETAAQAVVQFYRGISSDEESEIHCGLLGNDVTKGPETHLK